MRFQPNSFLKHYLSRSKVYNKNIIKSKRALKYIYLWAKLMAVKQKKKKKNIVLILIKIVVKK